MKALVLTLVVLLAGAAVWLMREDAGMPVNAAGRPGRAVAPELVIAEPVEYREIVDAIESIGTTHANESVTITSKLTDTVSRVHFEDGDFVEAGAVLVEMTNSEESALLAEARANLEDARRQLARQEGLGNRGMVAKSLIDEAVGRAEAAAARYQAITARMEDRLIRAPFSGLLGFRGISPGSLLTPSTPITTLDDVSIIKLDFSVPEIYLGVIQPGFRIISRSDAWRDREFEGVINSIGTRIDPVTRAVTVRAVIDNVDGLLRPGMLLGVRIITNVRQALVIPESAFIQIANETYVYIAGEDGLAHRQVIEVGARRFGYVEVVAGLAAGELVITEGGFKLPDKAPYRLDESSVYQMQVSGKERPAWPG